LFSNAFCFLQDPQPHRFKPICHRYGLIYR
jgi:hypothetical protein